MSLQKSERTFHNCVRVLTDASQFSEETSSLTLEEANEIQDPSLQWPWLYKLLNRLKTTIIHF